MFSSPNPLRYDRVLDARMLAPEGTASRTLNLVPPASEVLEVGCSTGYYSQYLREKKQCTVTAIEVDPVAAEKARGRCDRIIVGSAEQEDVLAQLGSASFDVLFLAGVLEHVAYPDRLLRRLRPLLRARGCAIITLPNIAHWPLRRDLALGRFEYGETGVLDRTHLRFFTLQTARELVQASGYAIEALTVSVIPPGSRFLNRSVLVRRFLERTMPGIVGQEIIIKAVPVSEAAALAGGEGSLEARAAMEASRKSAG